MNRLRRFEQAPMIASKASFLAGIYGDGISLDEYAAQLPKHACIADMGAGLSDFGTEIAARRPDITWTNLDYNYYRPWHVSHKLASVAIEQASQLHNLHFEQADVLNLPETLYEQYDQLYSYNLITHLNRVRVELGDRALRNMTKLLKPGGQLHIGPTNAKMRTAERWQAARLPAEADEEEVKEVNDLLTSPRPSNVYYNASDASGVGLFPATRFNPEAKGGLVLSDDGGQTCHKLLSPRGVLLSTRLVTGLFRR